MSLRYVDVLCDIVADSVRQADVGVHLIFAQTCFQHLFSTLGFVDNQGLKLLCLVCQNNFFESRVSRHADTFDITIPFKQLQNPGRRRTADFKNIFDVPLVDILPLRCDKM